MNRTLVQIEREVSRQVRLWGEQNHPDGTGLPGDRQRSDEFKALMKSLAAGGHITWRDILYEEMLEVFDATDLEELKTELVQVAAVAVSWVEAIDRRNSNGSTIEENFKSTS